jgi:hypothetical protein
VAEGYGDALLTQTLRRLGEQFDGDNLSAALAQFGFADLVVEDPRRAVSTLFETCGHAGHCANALQDVLHAPLAAVLSEGTTCTVVLPAVGAHLAGISDGHTVKLRGLVIGQRANTDLLAPVADGVGVAWVRLAADADAVSTRVAGLDPALGLTKIHGAAPAAATVLDGSVGASVWEAVLASGRRALSYQIIGAVGRMVDLAIEHATQRAQFGQLIGSFQSVRNRLAESYVARHAAAGALEQAWTADDPVLAAMLAKSLAGRAARIAGRHCQQVLAGIGFTAEHPFHRFQARALMLDSLLGSAADLPAAIGGYLVSIHSVPRLVEL